MAMSQSIETHHHQHSQNRYAVIPTAERLGADPNYTGRGVTVAFLDSGFYPHPGIADRVIAFHDIHGEERLLTEIVEPKGHHWHGTQTVVSCAGDGRLSDGVYRGLAHKAELVLVKASQEGRINDDSIEKGLRWVIENREKFDIRILNISLGGDTDAATSHSRINQLAEELVSLGVAVTVAAGNSAETRSIPPANSPSVITVGGYSDQNRFGIDELDLYHSSFGETADGIVKPEIIAPAMFVAAPILPETEDYRIAETLSMLAAAPDYSFRPLVEEFWKDAGLDADVLNMDDEAVRRIVGYGLHLRKIVATHYSHVDGTSFAAPIAASVVAQMIEANPNLSPAAVKNILVTTAERIKTGRAIRQGFGVINARRAVELAASEKHYFDASTYGAPRRSGELVSFTFHDDSAASVNLVGDFNDWDPTGIAFKRSSDGFWYASIKAGHRAKYRYKILIDGHRWFEDPSHGMKEEDGFGGFHSILDID